MFLLTRLMLTMGWWNYQSGQGGVGRGGIRKRVIEEYMREEFDKEWWPQHGDARVMEVWQERF